MNRKEFRELKTSEMAEQIISKIPLHPGIIELKLKDALGHILAEDIISQIDVPGFDRASMDGFAVRANNTYLAREDKPIALDLVGKIDTGSIPEANVNNETAIEISTGSMMPIGADAVVMVEYTRLVGDVIQIMRPVSINENVIHAGSDIMVGERVLNAGTRITSREIGVLGAVGIDSIRVKNINVGIISTGSELVEPGNDLSPGMVYDINSYSLGAAAWECGANVTYYGIARDDRREMENMLALALQECQLVLTSGSTSAGAGDVMYKIIEDKGKILLHGIDIKPGKPVIVGIIDNTPVFGLPGYPTSALTIFNQFVAPLIRSTLGMSDLKSKVKAQMALDFRSAGRKQLLPVGLVRGKAYPVDKGSGAITTLADADGFIEIEPEVEIITANDEVEVTLMGDVTAPDILFIGSHCLGFEVLMRQFPYKVRMINTGSSGALVAVRDGIADMGGMHLLDESGEYNLSFLKTFGLENAVLVKGYLREQGLIIKPDSNIQGFGDISGHRMINRNRGSGTRVFTDMRFHELADQLHQEFDELCAAQDGYDTEARTHSAVAAAVKLGRADVGVGIKPVADLNGLKFVHLADEEYDFVVRKEFIESRMGLDFLDILHSERLRSSLPPGIKVYELTGDVLQP
ncbi:MAG: molybdopterin biosynthesis protein [Nitrospirae bacterium]|nr:molybdopterin biosynthesis protein [Nitrospirota bacterium]